MKKITKILLPIASTAAVVAPVACLTSCGMMAKVNASAETQGKVFTITVIFNEEIPADKHGWYTFEPADLESDIYIVSTPSWSRDNKTVDIPCELKETYDDGKTLRFSFAIKYDTPVGENPEEHSREIYPCKTTYKNVG